MNKKVTHYFWQFLEPRYWWLRHIIYWLYNYSNYIFELMGLIPVDETLKGYRLILEMIPDIIIVYLNLWVLIPYFAKKNKVTSYIFISLLLILGLDLYYCWVYQSPDTPYSVIFFQYFVTAFELFLLTTTLWFLVEYLYNYDKIQEEQNQKLKTELAYLKNQINPHFLFNTLNNIATLSELYPERVTPVIIELSNVLRYQLYESEKETVFLADEIENLKQNLHLEAMRLNKAKAEIGVEGNPNGKTVAPLLFLPFLENSLKHSADPSGVSTIDILFKIEENILVFTAKNSKPTIKAKQLAGGLGLKNIKRRLELLYPQKHELTIEDTEDWYFVELRLDFLKN